MKLSNLRRSFSENGWYVTFAESCEWIAKRVRGRLLYRKLGAKNLQLGPRPIIRGLCCIRIGQNFSAGQGLWLEAITQYNGQPFTPTIKIGNNVCFSQGAHVAATNSVEIGDGVLLGSKVIITDHNHGSYSGAGSSPVVPPTARPLDSNRGVSIGAKVWIGDGVVVTPGCTIGEGAVIGANSVVYGVIPPFTVSAGAPARILKRFDFDKQEWVVAT
ncbi:MAG: acetyltransferase [Acidobacteria bacterium]|jgi:lipopolysaccharide O-acetyltransferase|nr:MAG: acetyltransferase [Acidobacteriota bacterium]